MIQAVEESERAVFLNAVRSWFDRPFFLGYEQFFNDFFNWFVQLGEDLNYFQCDLHSWAHMFTTFYPLF